MAHSATKTPTAKFWRPDVIAGAAVGLGIALAFGTPLLSTLGAFWQGTVLPAFYNLGQTGLAWCG